MAEDHVPPGNAEWFIERRRARGTRGVAAVSDLATFNERRDPPNTPRLSSLSAATRRRQLLLMGLEPDDDQTLRSGLQVPYAATGSVENLLNSAAPALRVLIFSARSGQDE